MEIRRFGIGHRRPDGPPGTRGVQGLAIHSDARGALAELALERGGSISPHSNPNLTYFLVIEGGGFVSVGEETARVSAGDAVVWPPHVEHAAWTEVTPMRAIVVEFSGAEAELPRLPARVEVIADEPAAGALEASRVGTPIARDGEPW
jgi:quercetin dioxygenase-like cupin family protein